MKRTGSRAIFGLVLALLVAAVAGGGYASQVRATTNEEADAEASRRLFSTLLSLVEENSATEIDSDKAVYGAIDGMLRTLDPHSKFFNPKDFRTLREDQRGRYYGLGITVSARFGKVTVVSPPFPGSPAEKVGLRVGDVITHVNGEPTKGLELNDVVARLKGDRGTTVRVTIARPGIEEPIQYSVVRDEIAKFTISNSFLIRPKVGYIKIESFAETTSGELRQALNKLDNKNLDGLILDLRNNPGGLLQEAIEVSQLFLQKGQAILETRGRTSGSVREYVSERVNNDNTYPLVVLINQASASASEIVAGAIQDHDRGLILGQTSFGKGLVQSVYPLSKNAGLALTTQKWYTPSQRLIQRDYSHISQFDYYSHRGNPAEQPKTDIHRSLNLGRVLYGGGGITPDHIIEDVKANELQETLAGASAYYRFVQGFLAKNPKVDASFQVSDAMLAEFKQALQKWGIPFTDADFEANSDFIRREIRREVVYARLGVYEASRVMMEGDPLVLKAIELLPEAKDLYRRAREAPKSNRQVVQQR